MLGVLIVCELSGALFAEDTSITMPNRVNEITVKPAIGI